MNGSIRLTVVALLLIVLLIFGLVVGRQVVLEGDQQATEPPDLTELNTYVYEESRPLAEFELRNEQGETVTRESLKGRWTFAFVGFTNCPDICPAAMATLRETNKLIPDELPQPEYLLVSADPEHDTPEKLREYLSFFGENFRGLTGDLDTLRALAKSLGAVFVHRETEDRLLVDHSGHFALIDPEAKVAAMIQPPHDPESLVESYQRIYQWARSRHPRVDG